MAQVPVVRGPNVAPSGAPLPTQQITPPPEAFGATVAGQALGELGQTFGKTSDELSAYAQQFQQINNKTAADDASNKFIVAADQARVDYSEANKNSMSAVDNLPDFYKSVETVRGQLAGNLSPAAKIDYDSATRRYAAGVQGEVSTYAVAQRNVAINNTTDGTIQLWSAKAAAHPDDPNIQTQAVASIGSAMGLKAQANNWDDTTTKAQLQKIYGSIYAGQIHNAVNSGDVQSARKLFDAHVDGMDEAQVTQALGELKAATISTQAAQDGLMVLNGVPAPPVANPVPGGKWDTGVAALRANPTDALTQLVGQPVTVTSGQRSVEHNTAVGGAPNSEHLSNTAWDFVPSKGNLTAAASTLATNLHAAGIPFDQIEVDQANGHVHVGFGPKNRNEIIDQHGTAIPQGMTVAGLPAPVLPSVGPTTEPEAYNVAATTAAETWVQQRYPNNPIQQERSLSAMESSINLRTRQIKAEQDANFTSALGQVNDQNLQDISAIPPATLARMSPSQVVTLKNATKANANELTTARMDNANTLKWMAQQDPQAFLKLDMKNPNLDLTRTERTQMFNLQLSAARQAAKGTNINTLASQALNSVEGQQAMKGIIPTGASGAFDKSSPEYARLAGALQAAIEHAAGPDNKPVPQKELNLIISQVTARVGATPGTKILGMTFGGTEGTPSFEVPASERDAIIAKYKAKGLNYTEQDIGYTYAKAKSRAP